MIDILLCNIVEEQIPMNIKRGMKRIWILISVYWIIYLPFQCFTGPCAFDNGIQPFTVVQYFKILAVTLSCFWIIFILGSWIISWVASGFSSDKKKDETNE